MRRRPLLRRILLGLTVATAVLLGAEGLLRLAFPLARTATLPPEMIEAHLRGAAFRWDPDLYWYWPQLPVPGPPINAQGFRRRSDIVTPPPPGTRRVIAFGDSQTFGAGLDVSQAWPAVAERELGPGWEVLNAGISGYRTLNVYRLLRLRIEAFEPDAIIVDCMPFDSPRDDGEPLGRPLGAGGRLKQVLWQSRLYHALRLTLEKLDPGRPRWLDEDPAGELRGGRMHGNHDRIAEWGRSRGVEVVFMQYAVKPSSDRIDCQTRPGELPPGPEVVPACEALLADGRSPDALFLDHKHLTIEGAEVVGKAAAATLRRAMGVEGPG